jgi:hypothetical protein
MQLEGVSPHTVAVRIAGEAYVHRRQHWHPSQIQRPCVKRTLSLHRK